MALFKKNSKVGSYEVINDGEDVVLRIDYDDAERAPSVEDDPVCMANTCDKLIEVPNTTRIVFYQKRDYVYDTYQTELLKETALLFNVLAKDRSKYSFDSMKYYATFDKDETRRYNDIQHIIFQKLKADPLGAFVELRRIIRHERIKLQKIENPNAEIYQKKYIDLLMHLYKMFDQTRLVTLAKPYLEGYTIGDRSIYRKIFKPDIKPDFMFTKLMATYPSDGVELDSYSVGETEVTIFKFPDSAQYMYHIVPPEFKLTEEEYEILDLSRRILAEHKPDKSEFVNPTRMREVFSHVGRDLLEELSLYRNINLSPNQIENLSNILVRYTVGFGLVEILLQDEEMQDISINSPYGKVPIFIVHGKYDDCRTNVVPTKRESESWATKLRMISGRPLDESNPILDTELEVPGASVRTSTITEPLDPTGLAFSFRKHRDKPWTFPLFMKNKMINKEAAGLLSFLIDGTRTFFVCGTRSSGKSSFLSSMMIEIMRRYRVITIEDTLELPFNQFKDLGYNIIQMKVASALARGSNEFTASEGIRSTLRLGDSSLVVGEVRSKEVVALFEAMRVGAGSNVVAGTFHSDTPYGVYDRCVNALGIPNTSFKALDVCIIANPIKSADGLSKKRRVLDITEVRKDWTEDPMKEGGFGQLMKYNSLTDQLEFTPLMINGESDVVKAIAANISDFSGDWNLVWENIKLRGEIKQLLVDYAEKHSDLDALESPFVIRSSDRFHNIVGEVKESSGKLDHKRIFFEFEQWLKREFIKRKNED